MSFFSTFTAITKYFSLAAAAVQEVQAAIGPSNGDVGVQQSKAAAAVAIVLAVAHAGENVSVAVVQQVSQAVEIAVSVANALGLFGKTAKPAAVAVPKVAGSTTAILD
jgi:hypothetical protein